MGSGPLAQPLFYQYRCTYGQADRLCRNGSGRIRAIHARLASINIKRGNLITHDLLGLPARSRARLAIGFNYPNSVPQPITLALGLCGHRSRGSSAGPA